MQELKAIVHALLFAMSRDVETLFADTAEALSAESVFLSAKNVIDSVLGEKCDSSSVTM
jgi:hypothetical protein